MNKTQLNKIIKEEIQKLQEQNTPNSLMQNFGAWVQQSGVGASGGNFKELLACGDINAPQSSQTQMQMISWLQFIFTHTPFTSGATTQPCQFINGRIDDFQTWIANFPGNPNSIQLAQKKCKLELFQQMLLWAQDPNGPYGC